ncbi:transport permease protein [Lentzea sp. NBRC 105346]|uniref:ABC transporter permease n=1 Tax=Lentzea sp. NBRC 105346 TaxID=3032205 RepID=UPI0024A28627|nr:ABC transporter permease [Lentzea sp. NBRC 105346]GLZ31333.1 transport permease protein [Lentzea sp. NBRC 105346]
MDGLVLTGRNLLRIRRMPQMIILTAFQPVVFLLLFGYVFADGIVVPGGGDYREFVLPGIATMTMVIAAVPTATGLAADRQRGVVDRFQALPISRSAVLVGRTLADLAQSALVIVIMLLFGLLIGWRVHTDLLPFVTGIGVLLLFGFAFSWVGVLVGASAPSVEAATNFGMIWGMPLTFLSNAIMPVAHMPGWLQPVAAWNPFSATVAACRELWGNPIGYSGEALPMQHPVVAAVVWPLLICLVVIPLSIRRYQMAVAQ